MCAACCLLVSAPQSFLSFRSKLKCHLLRELIPHQTISSHSLLFSLFFVSFSAPSASVIVCPWGKLLNLSVHLEWLIILMAVFEITKNSLTLLLSKGVCVSPPHEPGQVFVSALTNRL